MEDFYTWSELTGKEKILAIDNFRKSESKDFNNNYTVLQAIDVLRERKDFIKDIEDGKVVNVF